MTAVRAVEGPREMAPVYNLEVEDYHSYLVGAPFWGFAVWAHNAEYIVGASGGPRMRSPSYGNYVRRVDDFKHALEAGHVKAALVEKGGGVVKINPATGLPFDHLLETRNAMHGAFNRIQLLKKYLSDPNLTAEMRSAVQSELSELSKMLDNAERILGELAQ